MIYSMAVDMVSTHICSKLNDIAMIIEAQKHGVLVDRFLACNATPISK